MKNHSHIDDPRTVEVRGDNLMPEPHYVVYGGIGFHVATKRQADALMASWRVIMNFSADKGEEVVAAVHALESSK